MSFLPDNYKEPATGGQYLKLQVGKNRFRIMGNSVVGYEYFNTDNKPLRSKEPFTSTPDIKDGGKVKYFMAFPIWNYDAQAIQIAQFTQRGIKDAIANHARDEDWGNPVGNDGYDFIVERVGQGIETEYSVVVKPKSKLPQEAIDAYEEVDINLEALFIGENPFASVAESTDDDLPF